MVLDKFKSYKAQAMDGGELSRPTGADSTLQPTDLRSRDFRKILLIKLSAVGDVVHTIPLLNKLRQRYAAARIDWLVTPAIAELLAHNPAITNVVEFQRQEWSKRSNIVSRNNIRCGHYFSDNPLATRTLSRPLT